MERFKEILRRAARRHGGAKALEAELPRPRSRAALRRTGDDRYLSAMTRCVFRAGFQWRVVEAKWPGFEDAFAGFEPDAVAALTDGELRELATDRRVIRNPQKLAATRANARFVCELAEEHGSAGRFLANWPPADIVGLWQLLHKRGSRLGGHTGAMFLREVGVDTPMLTGDVLRALVEQGVLERPAAGSRTAQRALQDAFNTWCQESGRSLSEVSKVLACSVGD